MTVHDISLDLCCLCYIAARIFLNTETRQKGEETFFFSLPKISWLQRADDGVQCDAEKYSQPKCLNLRSRGLLGRFGHLLKSFSSLCMLKLAFFSKRFIFRASGSYRVFFFTGPP